MKNWRRRSLTALLREALTGTEQDFTEGSLTQGIILLGVPTMLELVMESTFGVVDSFWIAKLGANTMAAAGLTESLVWLVFSVAIRLARAAIAATDERVARGHRGGYDVCARAPWQQRRHRPHLSHQRHLSRRGRRHL